MVFATEPVTGCLKDGIERPDRRSNPNHPSRSHPQINLELDEVEVGDYYCHIKLSQLSWVSAR